jgi:mRNA-degrading endonuclease RelE of RelBE toxin-antitoxin system
MALVLITPAAQRQFEDLPRAVQARMERIFVRLEDWPNVSGAKRLSGNLAGHCRMRTGDYRAQFYVESGDASKDPPEPDRVVIEKVGHRDGFYDD